VNGPAGLPESNALVSIAEDPGAVVVAALAQAKEWLARATTTDLPELVEAKARAEAIRCYVIQKELGQEAELSAAEIVRRAERRIGELVREGQSAGQIRRRGDGGGDPRFVDPAVKASRMSPKEYLPDPNEARAAYEMADGISPDLFEEAVEEAKAEKNLSRANVVRKVRSAKARKAADDRAKQPRAERIEQIRGLASEGRSSEQIAVLIGVGVDHVRRLVAEEGISVPADEAIGRARRIDPNRIVSEAVMTLEALASALELVDFDGLDQDQVGEWAGSLRRSLLAFHRFVKEMNHDQ
jgi:hypothetical protein